MGVKCIYFDLISDLRGVTLHPRVTTVSALAVVFGDMGHLAAEGAGPGVGAALEPGRSSFTN